MSTSRLPTLFISHGGGPWPYIPEMKAEFSRTAAWLEALPGTLPSRPKMVLSISGHWEEDLPTVSSAAKPPMIFDYSGFPEHTYRISYPAPGSPALAGRVRDLLGEAKIECRTDPTHGFDHGTFVPLVLMFPLADVPVVSLSLQRRLNAGEHLRLGAALAPLRDEGVLIMGSGLSYHNMRSFRDPEAAGPVSEQFETWLTETVTEAPAERGRRLGDWTKAPGARQAHPREDHLIPLMVVAGAAGSGQGKRVFVDRVWGVTMSSYQFD